MKTIIEINSTNYASTGNITINIAKKARDCGFNVITFTKSSRESRKHKYENQMYFGFTIERIVSHYLSLVTGLRDYFNIFGTLLLIRKITEIKPDLLHIHVLHDNIINIPIFFGFIRKLGIPLIWTFHDTWQFTGQCVMFDVNNCEKWKNGCNRCPYIHEIPKSLFFDTTSFMWNKKKKLFSNIDNLTIVTPSKWLSEITKKSFFNKYNTIVINNGIDLNIFSPIKSTFKLDNKIANKYMILGVANYWDYVKGLDVFVELSKILPDNYKVVLVGTNDDIDKILPSNVISIHRTYNQNELAKIYASADLFVNPSRDENFPTVNIESLACGTPVITFNTGGSPEIIDDKSGTIVEKNSVIKLKIEIMRICENKKYHKRDCIKRANAFDMNNTFENYVNLYRKLLNN